MRHLDLFSGIGGFAIAAEMVWDNVEHTFCDIDPFAQAILKKHWPNSKIYGDIRQLTADAEYERLQGGIEAKRQGHTGQRGRVWPDETQRPFILTGGFPCQPFSQAGRRRGTEDDRYLWPEMLRVIREFHPRWIIAENVRGLLTLDGGVVFEQVCADLEASGYEVQAFVIPACAVNAPHRRDRVWIVANSENGRSGRRSADGRTIQKREFLSREQDDRSALRNKAQGCAEYSNGQWRENWLEAATRLCTVDDGLPGGLVRPRGWRNAALKGAGNAIVPQVAVEIMRAIKEVDNV